MIRAAQGLTHCCLRERGEKKRGERRGGEKRGEERGERRQEEKALGKCNRLAF